MVLFSLDPSSQLSDIQRFVNVVIADLITQDPLLIAFCTPFAEITCFGYDTLDSYRVDDTIGSYEIIDTNQVMTFRP
jgi:hypothetical protein